MKKLKVGVLGSGQLGQMMAEEALHHGIDFFCYSPDAHSPIEKIGVPVTKGAFSDLANLSDFLRGIDILTFEFENIPKTTLDFLTSLQSKSTVMIYPNPDALVIAQDRYLEKSHLKKLGLKTPNFALLNKTNQVCNFPFPWIIKTLRFGYDGKGQTKINSMEDFRMFLESAFKSGDEEYLIEEKINFDLEVSVILTRFIDGKVQSFGTIENIHKNHILDLSIFPARIDGARSDQTVKIAEALAESLGYVGTMGVEFFIKGTEIYLNEFAPRPHNSGHFSQDCGSVSQFKLHIAAITDQFRPTIQHPKPTVMKNIIGDKYQENRTVIFELLRDDRYVLHLYGKEEGRVGRKMGHLNFRGPIEEVSPMLITF